MNEPLWGIDLGGTKIEGVIMTSLENPEPVLRTRIETEGTKGYQHILGQIQKLVKSMESKSGLKAEKIGFGTPGVLDPILQTMKNCNSTALNGMPLKKDLEDLLQVGVELANDANCFALAETYWGAVKQLAPEASVVFGIIMGTGVGAGIVVNGKLWNGRHGIAGEWGHNFLDESGGICYCGKTGCVEKVLAGPSLQRYYSSLTNSMLTLKEIAQRHQQGSDKFATQTMDRLHHFFGKAISVVINILDPDVIVIGGGVGNIESVYTEANRSINQFIFNNRVDVQILRPGLGDSAGVFGAAALVVNTDQ
jgi:predicted NBD/HSP70 family sugar kinase